MSSSKTSRMAMDAVMVALCAVLGYLSPDFGFAKISLESLPVMLAALLLGPADGMIVGAMGTFLCQFVRYGLTATTVLWMMPYVVMGLVAGRYALRRRFQLSRKQILFITLFAEIMVSLMNTGVLYVDSRIYGYFSVVYIFGMLAVRIPLCAAKAAAFGALLPGIVGSLRRGLHLRPKEDANELQ